MNVYIAGRLTNKEERGRLEEIEVLCAKLGFKTFLPHRDVGLAETIKDAERIFYGDVTESLANSDVLVALLDGLHVGAGTAWELGYAYAKKIPAIGLKTDEPISDALAYLSVILIHSMPIATSVKQLESALKKFQETKVLSI
jgi:nucleoside 2-deoxyribosyltransferase